MKTLLYILFGVVYGIIYLFFAIMSTGGGHGNGFLLIPLLAWLPILAAMFLLTRLDSLFIRVFFVIVMMSHYFLTLLLLLNARESIIEDWNRIAGRGGIFVTTAVYIFGQLIIWFFYFTSVKNQKQLS